MKIKWTESSKIKFLEVLKYISEDSRFRANEFYEEINLRLNNLVDFPKLGQIKFLDSDNVEIRQLIIGNYLIFYKIIGNYILVVSFYRCSQKRI